jgi:hypothetical protein
MGAYGRRRVQEELEWRHEAPRLLAAYAELESHFSAKPNGSSMRAKSERIGL